MTVCSLFRLEESAQPGVPNSRCGATSLEIPEHWRGDVLPLLFRGCVPDRHTPHIVGVPVSIAIVLGHFSCTMGYTTPSSIRFHMGMHSSSMGGTFSNSCRRIVPYLVLWDMFILNVRDRFISCIHAPCRDWTRVQSKALLPLVYHEMQEVQECPFGFHIQRCFSVELYALQLRCMH